MAGQAERTRSGAARRFARDILFIVVAAVVLSFVIKTFVVRSYYIPSGSMLETLQVDDHIIVNELEPRFVPISRGDVVVFTDPGGWLPAGTPAKDDHLVKRVIGLPGDKVSCCGNFGSVRVNGVPIDEPYIKRATADGDAAPNTFDVTVPKGELWVMGDNRFNSDDSLRHHVDGDANGGFLPESAVVGRAIVVSWPISHWSWLDDYPMTFRGTDPDSD